MTRLSIGKPVLYIGLIILGISIGLYLGSNRVETVRAAAENQPYENLASPEEPTVQHVCAPSNVAVFTNRIHVRCATATDAGIRYFAVATSDSRHAARVLSLLLTAKASGQRVGVDYGLNDVSGVNIGCLASDCRLIRWVYIVT